MYPDVFKKHPRRHYSSIMTQNTEEKDKDKEKEINDFLKSILISPASTEEELYKDPVVTAEQKKRDEQITRLLIAYVDSYEKKVNGSRWYRVVIFLVCIGVVIAIACALRYFACRVANWENELQISNLVAFVTACISFVSLIIGLLTIITKYFFPENDEQYITQIVESIQKNDLENKRENAKQRQQLSRNYNPIPPKE